MRFLLLNQFYPPDLAPTGRVLHDLARTLAGRGHEVHAIASRRSYAGGEASPGDEMLDGVRVHRLPALSAGRGGFLARIASSALYLGWASLKTWLTLPRPDVIVALTTPPHLGLVARGLAALRGSRHAHWIMDVYPDVLAAHQVIRPQGFLHGALEALTRIELATSDLTLAIGHHMGDRVGRYAKRDNRVREVPLWGSRETQDRSDAALSLRAARGWAPDELVLMYSGNMGLGHRFGEFLAAASRRGPRGPRWAFVGEGKRRHEIETFATAHPEARLELLPHIPQDQLFASLSSADVHLISLDSSWQGLMVPSKTQDAFSVGRPVIFVGGLENEVADWIRESGGGWVVHENDMEGLLRAVDQASDPAERARRGEAARRFARERFDRARNCNAIADLLEAIPAGRRT